MSIVHAGIAGATVADLFAGTGALGLEALSRGAARVDFVDTEPAALALLQSNLTLLGALPSEAVLHRADAFRVAEAHAAAPWDLAFADPPYRLGLATRLAECWLAAPFARILGVEHDAHEVVPGAHDARRYGTTMVSFYYANRT